MPLSRSRPLALLAFVLWVGPAAAQPPAVGAAVRDRMDRFVRTNDISGAVTVVGRADGVVGLDAVGLRDIEAKAPMRPDTLFRIASMTKPVTAVAVMVLVDAGKLGLDDPVEKHLPEFAGQWLVADKGKDTLALKKPARPITVRDLLTHTSGLPSDYPAGLGNVYHRRDRTLAEAIGIQSQQPLVSEPGVKWAYCNAGIDALGRLVEVAGGERFEAFVQKHILDPLGMAETTFYPTPDQQKRLAAVYNKKDGRLVPGGPGFLLFPPDARHPIPCGGLCSTAADLARFYRMMLSKGQLDGKQVLSGKAVAEMTRDQLPGMKCGFVPGSGMGLGFLLVRHPEGVTEALSPGTFGHGGYFGTQAWADPVKGVFYVLLIQRVGLPNADGSEMRKAFQEVAGAALGS